MSGLSETCDQIGEYMQTCANDPQECEFSREMLEESGRTVANYIHSMNSISRVCTLPEIPRTETIIGRCEQSMLWSPSAGFPIDDEIREGRGTETLGRKKRFVITIPSAIIGYIIGLLVVGTGSVVVATSIAGSEAQRITEEEAARRVVDKENSLVNVIKVANVSPGLGKGLALANYKRGSDKQPLL